MVRILPMAASSPSLQLAALRSPSATSTAIRLASNARLKRYVFSDGQMDLERLKHLVRMTGKHRLILDLSCRKKVLAATQTPGEAGMNWFQGTADAVRQFIWVFEGNRNKNIEHILILSGDQLYRMDYMDFVQKHIDNGADITVSCVPAGDRYLRIG